MLSKMNLISVVQQLPKEDIEIVQGYVEMIEEENKELKERLRLIEEYYEESNFTKKIIFYSKYIKEKKKNANHRNDSKDDTTRNNTICDNSNGNTWDNEISKIFNGEKVEKENN